MPEKGPLSVDFPGGAAGDGPSFAAGDRDDLARAIFRVAHLTGEFTLRSGLVSDEYFDKYLFEADPHIIGAVVDGMAPLIPKDTEVLAGLELGGVPLATLLSRATGLPAAFVRKQAKPHGTRRLAEGAEVHGRRVAIIEDVVTSGGQIVISTGQLRELGADITCAVCAIDRQQGGGEALAADGVELRSLLTRAHLDKARLPQA
jgi:orotate phosphoribosyltransferase